MQKLCALCQINETGRKINKIPVCSPCFRAGEYNLPENRDRLLDDVKAASAKRKAQKAKKAKALAAKQAKKPAPKKPAPKPAKAKAEAKEPEQPEEPESTSKDEPQAGGPVVKDEVPDTGEGEGVPEEPATGS